jgi:RimJ/RimL family protein N-acetyltransferase
MPLLPLTRLEEPQVTRRALEALTLRPDGTRAAANTIIRKRAVSYNALGYAVELGLHRRRITSAAADPTTEYMLAVAGKDEELVGAARLATGEYESATIGFALRPDQWGQGKGLETVRLLQRLGFTELGLHWIWGRAARSIRRPPGP